MGKTYTAPDGKTFRPSLFVTLTCPSYGRVGEDGTPADPAAYDYDRAARDALAFAALFDRFIQNLRRYLGYDVQYFAAIEPQRRLAPHVHLAMRGTVSRAELRRVLAATYHQVWWPDATIVKYDGDELPVWDEATGSYLDPATGEVLPTWDQALDAIGPDDEPWHVARFGDRFDAQGVLAGSKDAGRCIGYLTKYLTKQVGDCHQADTDAAARRTPARLAEALRYQPCSPRCANWLRYGIQPKNARPGLVPGRCKGKAHDADHLGYAGRRVLVSRKWSGKTLADHRADRKDWLLRTLGVSATDPARYAWEPVAPADPDHMDHARRLLHAVADRARWQAALSEARRRAAMPRPVIFRQRERRHDGQGRNDSAFARRERGSAAAWDQAAVRPAPDRGTTDRVSQGRPPRAHQRSCSGRVHQGRARRTGGIRPQEGGLMPGKRRFGRVRELPSGRWQARYKGPDGIDRPAPQTFDSKTSAERWLTLTEAEIIQDDWIDPDAGRVLFGKYASDWIEERPDLRPKTTELYRYLLRRHLAPTFDARLLAEIREPHVRRWRKDLLDARVSAVTVAKAYRLLKAIFNTAVDDGLIRRNPCRIKGAGQEKSAERPVLTVAQVYALADAADERYRALVLLAAFSSLRWGELAALRRSDIDIQARTVRVARQLNERRGGGFVVRAAEVRCRSAYRGDTRADYAGPGRARRDLRPARRRRARLHQPWRRRRSGTPTSVAGSGYPPWRRPGSRRSTFTVCAIPETCSVRTRAPTSAS